MTGPEHYAEAERLLADVANLAYTREGANAEALAEALVHAQLATAAAVALGGNAARTEWFKVAHRD